MAETTDTLWLPVLPSMRGFGPALAKGTANDAASAGSGAGKKFGLAMVAGVAAAGVGVAAAGAALYKVGAVFEDVTRTIRVGSGASGAALDDLVGSAKRIGSQVPAEFDKIAGVVADVSTRMGLTGDTMDKVASQYLEAGRILGEDVDIGKTSAAFAAFKIEGEDVSGAMDHLFQVSQATGVGMNELADAAARNAPAMQTLGFSFEETTVMVGSFDKAGLNSTALMASMSKGLVTLAKDGEEPAAAFKRVQGEIAGFIEKGDEAGALNLASKVFGTKGASQFIGAIKSGALGMDDMSKAAGQTDDTILGLGKETMSFSEQWMMFKNKILVWLEPLASKVFGAMAFAMKEVTDGVTAFGAAWEYNDGEITSSGLPGMMELLGYWARQTFDYFKQTVIPNLQRFGNFLKDNVGTIKIVAGVIAAFMIPALVRLGVQALLAGARQVAMWAAAGGGAVKAGITYTLTSFKVVAAWVLMGVQALLAGARMAAAWLMALGPIGLVIAIIAAVVAAFVVAYNKIGWFKDFVDGAVKAIGGFFTWLWNSAIKPAFAAIGAVFTWLWDSVVKPVFGFIQAYINTVFIIVRAIFQVAVAVVKNILAPAFIWLYNNVVKPMFQAIGDFIGWVWNKLITPIFTAIKWYIDNVLGPVFTWLWKTIIKPAFDGIGSAISWVWEKVIKPVFDFLSNAIEKNVPAAFQKGIDGIKRIWDTIQDIAKKPVIFLIDTVINDGIIGAFNKLAGFIDPGGKIVKPLGKVAKPAGFRNGGYTGKGHPGEYAGPVHRDEHVIKSPSRRSIEGAAPGFLEALNRHGASALAGFNGSGEPRLGLFGGFSRSIANAGKVFVRDNAAGWDVPGALRAWQGVSGLQLAIGNGSPGINVTAAPMNVPGWGTGGYGYSTGQEVTVNSFQSGLAAGLKRAIVAHEIGHSLGLAHITSPASIMHPAVATAQWPTGFDVASMRMAYGMPGAGAKTYGPGEGGISFPKSPFDGLAESLMGKLKSAFPGGGMFLDAAVGMAKMGIDKVLNFFKDIAGDIGKKIAGVAGSVIDGVKGILGFAGPSKPGAATGANLNPLLYDQGGILRPGLSSIMNATGKPEAIYTNEQNRALQVLAARGMESQQGRGDIIFRGNVGWDPNEVANRIETKRRDTFAAFGI